MSDKIIPLDKLCVCCQRQEISSWSDSYCAKCDDDKWDGWEDPEPKVCQFCGHRKNSPVHYYCKQRMGLT